MKIGAFISGGKDSMLALHKASIEHEVVCIISVIAENRDSFMFHTVNNSIVDVIAECIKIPLFKIFTSGEKEKEVEDVINSLKVLDIDGIVIGGIESEYQKKRFEKICKSLDIKMLAPLWKENPENILREVSEKFEAIIVRVSAYGLDEKWLGRRIDEKFIQDLKKLKERFGIHLAGEGGEYETLVLDAPLYKRKIVIKDAEIKRDVLSSEYIVKEISVKPK